MKSVLMVSAALVATVKANGDSLITAIDAAYIRTVADGRYFDIMEDVASNVQPADCYAFPDEFPYPTAPTGDKLGTILTSGTIRVAVAFDDHPETPYIEPFVEVPIEELVTGVPQADPQGKAVEMLEEVVSRISVNYNLPISIQYNKVQNWDAAFEQVQLGLSDIVLPTQPVAGLYTSPSGLGTSLRRDTFKTSCAWFAQRLYMVVRKDAGYTKNGLLSTFKEKYFAGRNKLGAKVCGFAEHRALIEGWFDRTKVVEDEDVNDNRVRSTWEKVQRKCLRKVAKTITNNNKAHRVDGYITTQPVTQQWISEWQADGEARYIARNGNTNNIDSMKPWINTEYEVLPLAVSNVLGTFGQK